MTESVSELTSVWRRNVCNLDLDLSWSDEKAGTKPHCRCVNHSDSGLLRSDLSLPLLRRSGSRVHFCWATVQQEQPDWSHWTDESVCWVELSFCSGHWAKTHSSFQSLLTTCAVFMLFLFVKVRLSVYFINICSGNLAFSYLLQKKPASVYMATLTHYVGGNLVDFKFKNWLVNPNTWVNVCTTHG